MNNNERLKNEEEQNLICEMGKKNRTEMENDWTNENEGVVSGTMTVSTGCEES